MKMAMLQCYAYAFQFKVHTRLANASLSRLAGAASVDLVSSPTDTVEAMFAIASVCPHHRPTPSVLATSC